MVTDDHRDLVATAGIRRPPASREEVWFVTGVGVPNGSVHVHSMRGVFYFHLSRGRRLQPPPKWPCRSKGGRMDFNFMLTRNDKTVSIAST